MWRVGKTPLLGKGGEDAPVRSFKGGFAAFFLMSRPRLLYQGGESYPSGTISDWEPRLNRTSIPLGALSGALLVLSLPKPDLCLLAWVARVPLLFTVAQAATASEAFLASYVAGAVFFAGTCYWMAETMIVYGGLSTLLA